MMMAESIQLIDNLGELGKLMGEEKDGPLEQLRFVTEMLRILPGDTLKSKGISCFNFVEWLALGATVTADQSFWARRFREVGDNLDKKLNVEKSTQDKST